MAKDPVKNFYGQTIGYIETDEVTGDKVCRDFYNRILGYYDKKRNVTTNFYRQIVAKGDALSMLLADAYNKRKS